MSVPTGSILQVHRLYDIHPFWEEDTEEESYLITGYGEIEGTWTEFEFVTDSVDFTYNLQRHFKSPSLEPFEVTL